MCLSLYKYLLPFLKSVDGIWNIADATKSLLFTDFLPRVAIEAIILKGDVIVLKLHGDGDLWQWVI